MKPAKLLLVIAMVLCLSLVVIGQRPQQDQPQPSQQLDPDRFEAAHGQLLSGQDKAAEASRLTQAVASALPDTGSSFAPIPRKNFVDEHIFGRMEREHIPHAPLAGDEEFLRRAYLDATGNLPTLENIRSFMADKDPDKRDKLIDSLIGSEEFTDQWAYHWDELMRTRSALFHAWTKLWLKLDRPYNEVAYDILTPVTKDQQGFATAQTFYDPIAYISNRCAVWTNADDYKGFVRLDWIDEITSDIGRVFLGVNMDCFSCHNGAGHADSFNLFLGSMKRTDFWKQAAFFGKMRNIGSTNNGQASIYYGGSALFDDLAPGYNTGDDGNYYTPALGRFPRDGKTYEPVFFLTGEKPRPGEEPRKALARMLPNHVQFARATVNIVWQQLMVVGLVEPYDGFDLLRLDPKNPPPAGWTIQPANPELLGALAEDFRANNFSIQRVIKTIMKSNAYQLSTSFPGEWKNAYIPYYARRFARVLSGPEAADIIAEATDTPYALQQFGKKLTQVKQLTDPFNLSGRGAGASADEQGALYTLMQAYFTQERNLPPVEKNIATPVQAMVMMSSPLVNKRVTAGGTTRVANLLKSGKSDDEMIAELFLASLSRRPTAEEVEVAKRLTAKDRKSGAEIIQWSLLNSAEFLLNH
jgi:Protein of unknown function (DUF1549)/Protein of unknown function (DUF1553)